MTYFLPINAAYVIVILLSIYIELFKSQCINQTRAIGCGGSRFENAMNIVQTCVYPIYSRVELPNCRSSSSATTLFWYNKTNFCGSGDRVIGRFFAAYPSSDGQPCKQSNTTGVPEQLCIQNYQFNNLTMIIKNLTQNSVGEYICFLGDRQTDMEPSSAVTYVITFQGM